jgi:hypothetical protein
LARKSYEVRDTVAHSEAMIRCMKTALREVSSNGSKPEDMTKTIQVRVSDELHAILKEWAEIEGISMAALIRREFEGNPPLQRIPPDALVERAWQLRENVAGKAELLAPVWRRPRG